MRSKTQQLPLGFGNQNFHNPNKLYERRGTLMSYMPEKEKGSPVIQNFNAKQASYLNNQNDYLLNYRR